MSKKYSHKSTYYNDIALRLANNLFGVKHLHYGYFSDGLEPTIENLPEAQERYMKNLLSYIPDDVKKVFDVGCGTGEVAKQLIGMGKLKVHTVRTVVIDETDRMLYGDSLKAVERVVGATLRERQLVFVSATEQPESARVAESLAPGLVRVHTGCNRVVRAIEHCYLTCEERDKPDVLASLIHAVRPQRAIVFVHRNEDAEIIAAKLAHRNIAAADLHSARDKNARKRALERFRFGNVHILVASDVAARGLDVKGVTHIINVDAPTQSKAYLHRTGRTGRAGASGSAVSLMTEQDTRLVKRYETDLGIVMVPVKLRGGKLLTIETAANSRK